MISLEYKEAPKYLQFDVYFGDEYFGHFLLVPHSFHLYEVHTNLNKKAIGLAKDFAKEFLEFVELNLPDIQQLYTLIPANNHLARKLAEGCGFIKTGSIPSSYLYEDVFLEQDIYCYYSTGEK